MRSFVAAFSFCWRWAERFHLVSWFLDFFAWPKVAVAVTGSVMLGLWVRLLSLPPPEIALWVILAFAGILLVLNLGLSIRLKLRGASRSAPNDPDQGDGPSDGTPPFTGPTTGMRFKGPIGRSHVRIGRVVGFDRGIVVDKAMEESELDVETVEAPDTEQHIRRLRDWHTPNGDGSVTTTYIFDVLPHLWGRTLRFIAGSGALSIDVMAHAASSDMEVSKGATPDSRCFADVINPARNLRVEIRSFQSEGCRLHCLVLQPQKATL